MAESPRTDELIRALALGGRARVVAADTRRTVEELWRIHAPSPPMTAALGRAATGALLLAAALEKLTHREPTLTLEIDGGGPGGRILATASPAGWVRATAAHPEADAPSRPDGKLNVGAVVGSAGALSVTRDQGAGQPYRGVVDLVSGEIGEDLARYLLDSEQTPSAVGVGVRLNGDATVGQAGGYVIQLLPGVPEDEAAALSGRVRELGMVTDRLREGLGPDAWLARLFPEGYELLARQAVGFRCGCSAERVERALKLLGEGEVTRLIEEKPDERSIELTCGFCHARYEVPRGELERLRGEIRAEARERGGQHGS
jgi:molecular chaperone Hsp33